MALAKFIQNALQLSANEIAQRRRDPFKAITSDPKTITLVVNEKELVKFLEMQVKNPDKLSEEEKLSVRSAVMANAEAASLIAGPAQVLISLWVDVPPVYRLCYSDFSFPIPSPVATPFSSAPPSSSPRIPGLTFLNQSPPGQPPPPTNTPSRDAALASSSTTTASTDPGGNPPPLLLLRLSRSQWSLSSRAW